MNRKILVTLLHKDIRELEMITEGFMEMTEYPTAIIQLTQQKIDDLQSYIKQLSVIKEASFEVADTKEIAENKEVEQNIVETPKIEVEELSIVNDSDEIIVDEIIVNIEEPIAKERIDTIDIKDILDFTEDEPAEVEITDDKNYINTIVIEPINTNLEQKDISISSTRNELLGKIDNSLSASLANKKITDIKQAINIGDRFRFQRELFRGNGEDMNKTLNYINQLATLDEVVSFLQLKYGWAAEHETAEDFYQIVRRRF